MDDKKKEVKRIFVNDHVPYDKRKSGAVTFTGHWEEVRDDDRTKTKQK